MVQQYHLSEAGDQAVDHNGIQGVLWYSSSCLLCLPHRPYRRASGTPTTAYRTDEATSCTARQVLCNCFCSCRPSSQFCLLLFLMFNIHISRCHRPAFFAGNDSAPLLVNNLPALRPPPAHTLDSVHTRRHRQDQPGDRSGWRAGPGCVCGDPEQVCQSSSMVIVLLTDQHHKPPAC